MKFFGSLLVLAPQVAVAGDLRHLRATSVVAKTSRATPQDIDECLRVSTRFIHGPKDVKHVKELAVDFCAKTKKDKERGIVCPPFIEAIHMAMDGQEDDAIVTADSFCHIAEERMLEMRGASRVPNFGSGPLMNFTVASSCGPTLEKAMAPKRKMEHSQAADLVYLACMNQDCGHHLPSRTKWCTENHIPTHTSFVCSSARDFFTETTEKADEMLTGEDVCGLYSLYVKDLSAIVEAYEHMMHEDTIKRVPVPGQAKLAIQSTQLINDANSRDLARGKGKPVLGSEQMVVRSAAAAVKFAVLPLAAMMGFVRL